MYLTGAPVLKAGSRLQTTATTTYPAVGTSMSLSESPSVRRLGLLDYVVPSQRCRGLPTSSRPSNLLLSSIIRDFFTNPARPATVHHPIAPVSSVLTSKGTQLLVFLKHRILAHFHHFSPRPSPVNGPIPSRHVLEPNDIGLSVSGDAIDSRSKSTRLCMRKTSLPLITLYGISRGIPSERAQIYDL
jgi:hypothetical protein